MMISPKEINESCIVSGTWIIEDIPVVRRCGVWYIGWPHKEPTQVSTLREARADIVDAIESREW